MIDKPSSQGPAGQVPEAAHAGDEPGMAPMFGLDAVSLDAEALERYADAAAADIESFASAAEHGEVTPRNLGIATMLHGLWTHQEGASDFRTNIVTRPALGNHINAMRDGGFSPIDIVGSDRLLEPWTAAFHRYPPRDSDWIATPSEREFIDKDMALFNTGYRINSFNRRHGFFNATWERGNGTQWIRWDMNYISLLTWNKRYRDEGLSIVAIDRYGAGGNLYAAAWRPGRGEQIIEAPGGINTIIGQPHRLIIHKYEGRGLQVRAMGHSGYPIAVWRPASSSVRQGWYYGPPSHFRERDRYYRNRGYRLSAMSHVDWQF